MKAEPKNSNPAGPTVTVEISTKDRYFTTLPLTVMSVINQTRLPAELLIYDDGEQRKLTDEPLYRNLFALLGNRGIDATVLPGSRVGQVANHQAAVSRARGEWIWRLDDDDCPEPDALKRLVGNIAPDVGAIGGLVLNSFLPVRTATNVASGDIREIHGKTNLQWYRHPSDAPRDVDHLTNTFLYRRSAAGHGYPLNLSPIGHREETVFTYGFKLAGLRVLLDPKAVTWHLRQPDGGIRTRRDEEERARMYAHDETIFRGFLSANGVVPIHRRLVVINHGVEDHRAFRHILEELKAKCRKDGQALTLAVRHPEIFRDDAVELYSIQDAVDLGVRIDDFDAHRWAARNQWSGPAVDLFRAMYL